MTTVSLLTDCLTSAHPSMLFFPEQFYADMNQDTLPVEREVLISTVVEELAGLLEWAEAGIDLGAVN